MTGNKKGRPVKTNRKSPMAMGLFLIPFCYRSKNTSCDRKPCCNAWEWVS